MSVSCHLTGPDQVLMGSFTGEDIENEEYSFLTDFPYTDFDKVTVSSTDFNSRIKLIVIGKLSGYQERTALTDSINVVSFDLLQYDYRSGRRIITPIKDNVTGDVIREGRIDDVLDDKPMVDVKNDNGLIRITLNFRCPTSVNWSGEYRYIVVRNWTSSDSFFATYSDYEHKNDTQEDPEIPSFNHAIVNRLYDRNSCKVVTQFPPRVYVQQFKRDPNVNSDAYFRLPALTYSEYRNPAFYPIDFDIFSSICFADMRQVINLSSTSGSKYSVNPNGVFISWPDFLEPTAINSDSISAFWICDYYGVKDGIGGKPVTPEQVCISSTPNTNVPYNWFMKFEVTGHDVSYNAVGWTRDAAYLFIIQNPEVDLNE